MVKLLLASTDPVIAVLKGIMPDFLSSNPLQMILSCSTVGILATYYLGSYVGTIVFTVC